MPSTKRLGYLAFALLPALSAAGCQRRINELRGEADMYRRGAKRLKTELPQLREQVRKLRHPKSKQEEKEIKAALQAAERAQEALRKQTGREGQAEREVWRYDRELGNLRSSELSAAWKEKAKAIKLRGLGDALVHLKRHRKRRAQLELVALRLEVGAQRRRRRVEDREVLDQSEVQRYEAALAELQRLRTTSLPAKVEEEQRREAVRAHFAEPKRGW